MNYIQRQISLAILFYNLLHHFIGVVTPATLLITERPSWRQRHVPRKVGVTAENLLNRWSIKEIVIELAALGAKPYALLRTVAKVEVAAIAIVKKNSVSRAVV